VLWVYYKGNYYTLMIQHDPVMISFNKNVWEFNKGSWFSMGYCLKISYSKKSTYVGVITASRIGNGKNH